MTLVGLSEGDLATLLFSQIGDDVQTSLKLAQVSKRFYQISKQKLSISHAPNASDIIKICVKMPNGKLFGLEKKYYRQSKQLEFRYNFLNNRLHGLSEGWYENGQISYKNQWVSGNKHGERIGWRSNGQISHIANHQNGYRHGLLCYWYPDGQLKLVSYYKNGKLHGFTQKYFSNGQISYEANDVNGEKRWFKYWDCNKKCYIEENFYAQADKEDP